MRTVSSTILGTLRFSEVQGKRSTIISLVAEKSKLKHRVEGNSTNWTLDSRVGHWALQPHSHCGSQ